MIRRFFCHNCEKLFWAFVLLTTCFYLSSCSSMPKGEAKYPTGANRSGQANENDIYADTPSVFGEGGLMLLGRKDGDDSAGNNGIGVNSFLWRASLDTISFMPLASADPFGGTIITDWYSPDETPNERFKLNVFILDKQLRSDGVSVKVFRQALKNGGWRDVASTDATARQLEDAILTRARQMRVDQMNRKDD
ncbi:MAG: DUF3576 domain-containing protein [Alphaproteobacteria bacterium]|nr:DUF3576 domain-containing protein [Alphaproteobacteria bacterium]